MSIEALLKAVSIAGGQTALAGRIGKKQSNVWAWINRDKKVPSELAIPVARAVDFEVTPHELRPDIYPNPTDGLPVDSQAVA